MGDRVRRPDRRRGQQDPNPHRACGRNRRYLPGTRVLKQRSRRFNLLDRFQHFSTLRLTPPLVSTAAATPCELGLEWRREASMERLLSWRTIRDRARAADR